MTRKQLRKAMSPAGWTMVIYFIIINVCAAATYFVEMMLSLIAALASNGMDALYHTEDLEAALASSAWGYFVAAGVGLIILLAWKKPKFWREEIWARGKPMKFGDFFGILCIFLAGQLIYQIIVIGVEMILNAFGLTMLYGLESMSAGSDSFSMFLYMCVLAPVSEELLCRGLVQQMLMPYGKRLAILGSAFLFGIFHGNIIQAPYAFAVGLVLGYVAAEYSIAWAMVLHMINNLVLGDMMTRLTAGMNDMAAGLLIWGLLILCAIGAVITLVCRRREIRTWLGRNPKVPGMKSCFFGSAGVITFMVLMILSMIGTCFVLITSI